MFDLRCRRKAESRFQTRTEVVYQRPANQTTARGASSFNLLSAAMAFEQARLEGLCLRYPENLGIHASITYENAVTMLMKALAVSPQVPYTWGWIDKPSEGQVYLIFIPPQSGFPNDGIRYQEADSRYSIPAGSSTRVSPSHVSPSLSSFQLNLIYLTLSRN